MRRMKNTLIATGFALLASLTGCTATQSDDGYSLLDEDSGLAAWVHLDGRRAEWVTLEDGAVEVKPGSGNIISNLLFTDAVIELDFMTPSMPNATGQARGNSGVYMQGLYEVQILDSYGIEPGLDTCGAIYNVSVAAQSVCLPPGEWQHYKIDFTAPKFDATGIEPGRAFVGNLDGLQTPVGFYVTDHWSDGVPDLVLVYDAEPTRVLLEESRGDVGLRYEIADGTGYVVENIFEAGPPPAEPNDDPEAP